VGITVRLSNSGLCSLNQYGKWKWTTILIRALPYTPLLPMLTDFALPRRVFVSPITNIVHLIVGRHLVSLSSEQKGPVDPRQRISAMDAADAERRR